MRTDERACEVCDYVFDHEQLGRTGCPNCCGEPAEVLCDDEGCDHYGVPHVCVVAGRQE